MGVKRGNLVINGMPAKLGLMTAGRQQDIPETALWRAENAYAGVSGVIQKRPEAKQWGQTLMELNIDDDATGSTEKFLVDFLGSMGTLATADTSSGAITTNLDKAYLQFNVPDSGAGTYFAYQSGTTSATVWSLRLLLQATNLSNYAATTSPATLIIRAIGAAGTGKEFALFADGLYYKRASDNQYTLIDGTDTLGLGGWSALEIRYSDAGNTLVYVDTELVATISSALLADVSLSAGAVFEVGTRIGTTQYNARVAMLMYNDTVTDPFTVQEVVASTGFVYQTTSGSSQRVLVVAAGSYIYLDRMEQVFRPLLAKQRTDVFFTTYQRTLIWSDNDGGKQASVWQWDGLSAPELIEDAPNFVLMTEHQQRLCGVDRDHPLMVLISGDRKPDVYVDPDNLTPDDDLFDAVFDACAIPIPAKKSDVITAIWGDYYGSLIVWTTSSVWRITGSGIFSYALSNISQTAGAVNSRSVAQVGNDLYFGSYYGIHSLAATDKFGDIQAQAVSGAIQSMWEDGSHAPIKVNRGLLSQMRLAYHRTRSMLYVALPIAGELQLMVYNTATQQWFGPWDIESIALESTELESPLTEVMLHGGSEGFLSYSDFANTDTSSMVLEFANQNGRGVDPALIGMMKTFRRLRLYYIPVGRYDIAVRWYASIEDEYREEDHPQLFDHTYFTVGEDMRVDVTPDGEVYDSEDIRIMEIDLDTRGLYLNFDITESARNFVFLGYQLEFDADGYEVD